MISIATAITYRATTPIDLRHSVRLGGAPTSLASCNITIYDPNSKVLAYYKPMSFSSISQTYNFTLLGSNTTEVGKYNYDVTCLQGAFNSTTSYDFEVSNNGKDFTVAESITYIFMLLLSIALFCLFFYGAMAINPNNNHDEEGNIIKINYKKHLKLLCWIVCYFLLVWITFVSWNVSLAYIQLVTVANFFWAIHRITFAFMIPIIIGYVLYSLVLFIHDFKLAKEIERGFS